MRDQLKDYETVKQRKQRFYADHPEGSLVAELVHHEKGHCVMRGLVFKTKEDQEKNLPTGVGYAEEYQGQGGFANKHAWTENCDESAIGRALDNAGYSGNGKCSREEMAKVERHSSSPMQRLLGVVKRAGWSNEQVSEYIHHTFQVSSAKDLDDRQIETLIQAIESE